jgi:hypothetical protein
MQQGETVSFCVADKRMERSEIAILGAEGLGQLTKGVLRTIGAVPDDGVSRLGPLYFNGIGKYCKKICTKLIMNMTPMLIEAP